MFTWLQAILTQGIIRITHYLLLYTYVIPCRYLIKKNELNSWYVIDMSKIREHFFMLIIDYVIR